jgi:guanosine-3',5'-bis(diphosphate) 3'-pyrophosphohydrolase
VGGSVVGWGGWAHFVVFLVKIGVRTDMPRHCLHDTVEDTETTFEEIEEVFGTEVSSLVRNVTDDKSLEKAERKQLQIEHTATSSDKVKQIKIADKISNIRDITASPPKDWSLQHCADYLDWSQEVVSGCRGVNASLEQAFDDAIKKAHEVLN